MADSPQTQAIYSYPNFADKLMDTEIILMKITHSQLVHGRPVPDMTVSIKSPQTQLYYILPIYSLSMRFFHYFIITGITVKTKCQMFNLTHNPYKF